MFGLGLTTLGYLGLLEACRRLTPAWNPHKWHALSLAAGLLALAGLPLIVLVRDDQHPYQFYKLLLSVSPLFIVGLALLCQAVAPGLAALVRRPTGLGLLRCQLVLPVVALGVVAFLGALGMRRMAVESTSLEPDRRSNSSRFLAPDMREAQDRLEALHDRDLLIGAPYSPVPYFLNGWLAYFARGNRVLLAHPMINDMDVEQTTNPGDVLLPIGPRALPQGLLLLTSSGSFQPVLEGTSRRLWGNSSYELWEPGLGPWAVPLRESRWAPGPDAATPPFGPRDFPVTRLDVLASMPGLVRLSQLDELSSASPVRLQVETSGGQLFEVPFPDAEGGLSVPVEAGRTRIILAPPCSAASSAASARHPEPDAWVDLPQPQFRFSFVPGIVTVHH